MNYKMNEKRTREIQAVYNDDYFHIKLFINTILATGDPAKILRLYREGLRLFTSDKYELQLVATTYLAQANILTDPIFILGVSKMVIDRMVDLVVSNGFKFEGSSEKNTKTINEALEIIDYDDLLPQLERKLASTGTVFLRIHENDTKDNPYTLEIVGAECLEIEKERGRVSEIRVNKYKDKGSLKTKEVDIYDYETLEYSLKYYQFSDSQGDWIEDTTRGKKPVKLAKWPVYLMTNKAPVDTNSPYGESDIENIRVEEEILAELTSQLVVQIRRAILKTFISESLLPIDDMGNKLPYNDFTTKFNIMKSDISDADKLIQHTAGVIETEKFLSAIKPFILNVASKSGLSPQSLCFAFGVESINSSSESQVQRKEASIRTLERKQKKYTQMFKWLIPFITDIDKSKLTITGGEWVNPSMESKVSTYADMVDKGLLSRLSAMQANNPTLSEEDLMNEYIKVKIQMDEPLTQLEQAFLTKAESDKAKELGLELNTTELVEEEPVVTEEELLTN